MSTLQQAVADAGKLKQMCQSVLAIVTAAEAMGPLDQMHSEIMNRIKLAKLDETAAQTQLREAQQAVQRAEQDAKSRLQAAKTQAEALLQEAKTNAEAILSAAKEAVRQAYEQKTQVDAEVVAQRQEVTALQRQRHDEELKLADTRATIERLLRS